MPLITPEYLNLQKRLHIEREDYGISARRHIDSILALAQAIETRDILDYGCGKATLQKGIPWPIQNYDPAMPEYTTLPVPADIVVCTDVLEHIEPECLKDVLDDIRRNTKKALFLNVSCRPAKKILADGRNAHLIIETPNWWLSWLLPRFYLHAFQCSSGDFSAVLFPNDPPPQEPSDA